MKLGRVVYDAIIRRSDIHRHLIGVGVLAAIKPDVAFGPPTHGKDRESNPESHSAQAFSPVNAAVQVITSPRDAGPSDMERAPGHR